MWAAHPVPQMSEYVALTCVFIAEFLSVMYLQMAIILLLNCCVQNMVGPGEVDDELEAETAEECSKYGKVLKCLIFEVSIFVTLCFFVFFSKCV